jgi:hypothetical protein
MRHGRFTADLAGEDMNEPALLAAAVVETSAS